MQRTPPEGLCFELPVFYPLILSFLSLTSFFLAPGEPDRHSHRVDQGSQHGQGAGLGHHGFTQVPFTNTNTRRWKTKGNTNTCLVRSGETEDCFIADLVVGLGTGQIKTGAPCR